MRSEEILSCLYSSFDKARLDPILLSFKSSELLYDFYHKRIFEMISETLANSQEQAIVHLEEENRKLACMNSELQDKMTQMQASYSALSSENKSTVNAINHIEQEMKDKDEANQHLALTVTQLETQNEMLQNQIEELQIENKNSLDKINELINVLNAKECELVNKNEQINFFKENLQIIKAKQGELTGSLNGMIEQNFELKSELELKNNDLGELVSKIEELKLEFQQKSNEINKEVELLRNENEKVLKVKIQALKNKLREKIAIINKLSMHEVNDSNNNYSDNNDSRNNSISLGKNLQYQMTTAGNLLYE